MDLKKAFATDKKLELEGVWHDLGEGAGVLIARIGNRRYQNALNKTLADNRTMIKTGLMSEEAAEKDLCEIIADTILLDWKNIDDDGQPLPYTKENAVAMLIKYPDFRVLVVDLAGISDNYRPATDKEALGK